MKAKRQFAYVTAILLAVSDCLGNGLKNPSFEDGLGDWIHDQNTYPIGATVQPIGVEGVTVANMGTFDQAGSELSQEISLDKGTYSLRFSLGANSGNDFGRTAAVRVMLVDSRGVIANKDFSVVSEGYPSGGLGFKTCDLEFALDASGRVTLKFLDVSPNNGFSVDPMIDDVRLVRSVDPDPPMIVRQPVDQFLHVGESTTLAVVAKGDAALSYQWFKGSIEIPGATNDFLFLKSVSLASAGFYFVTVRSDVGQVASESAHISISETKNLVLNGGFENGLTAWSHDAAVFEISAGVEGTKAANLGTFDQPFSAVSQEVVVTPLSTYSLSFASAANAVSVVGMVSRLSVEVTASEGDVILAQVVDDVSAGFPDGPKGFTRRSFLFSVPANADRVVMTFRDVSADGGRAVDQMIDDVRLELVSPDTRSRIFIPPAAAQIDNSGSSSAFGVPIRLQEIYPASHFPVFPITISELRFRPDSVFGAAFDGLLPYVRFTISTTRAIPGALSLNFADNLSADQLVVYEGPWVVSTAFSGPTGGPKAPDIILPLQKSFRYDPAKGNLLLQIQNSRGLVKNLRVDAFLGGGVQRVFKEGDAEAAVASSSDLSADVIQLGFIPDISSPPSIVQPPLAGTVQQGQEVRLSVGAVGSAPLTFQWSFEGHPILGATNESLLISSADWRASGFYSVQIANKYGVVNSSPTFLLVEYPPTSLVIGSNEVLVGEEVEVPIFITANGIEGKIDFSLSFPQHQLRFLSARISDAFAAASASVFTNEQSFGQVGFSFSLTNGFSVPLGRQLLCTALFSVDLGIRQAEVATVEFGGSPIKQEVSDTRSRPLLVTFESGDISISFEGYESDLDGRPSAGHSVSVTDWVQVGRDLVGVDWSTNVLRFRKLDSAPRNSRGDGVLSASDWVQCGRYALGVDPVLPVGGPSISADEATKVSSPDAVKLFLGAFENTGYGRLSIPILIDTGGKESALSFSLRFNPNLVRFREIKTTPYSRSWKLLVNDRDAALGRIGVAIAPLFGKAFPAGAANELLRLEVYSAKSISEDEFVFCDTPAPCSVANTEAIEMPLAFGGVHEGPGSIAPVLEYSNEGDLLQLSWKTSTPGFRLEVSESPNAALPHWTVVDEMPMRLGNRYDVWLPKRSALASFRLVLP